MLFTPEYSENEILEFIRRHARLPLEDIYSVAAGNRFENTQSSNWKFEIGTTKEETITKIWKKNELGFPLFAEFLQENLLGLYIGKIHEEPHLLYLVKNNRKGTANPFDEKIIWGKLPATEQQIVEFETRFGPVSSKVRAIWGIHRIMKFVNNNILAEPNIHPSSELGSDPEHIGVRTCHENTGNDLDCLSIINTWTSEPYCLTKNPSGIWDEPLLEAEKAGTRYFGYSSTTIDRLLVEL